MNNILKSFLFFIICGSLISIFFIADVKAQEDSQGCLEYPSIPSSNCLEWNMIIDPCEPCTIENAYSPSLSPVETFLDIEVGSDKESAKEGIGALKAGAKKLNPLGIKGGPSGLLSKVIDALLAFIGSIALVLYIYAGFMWMSAAGNVDKVTKAKNVLVWTTLGAVAMGASYMMVKIVLDRIG